MLFNSIDFALFLPLVFALYWIIPPKHLKLQNLFIVVASYVFYGWWDWRFLFLIFFSTIVDYTIGICLEREFKPNKRKWLLWLSILVNLGLLGFFKYYNFFVDTFSSAFSFFGTPINAKSLNIILPVGISFYTFQTLSYTIDVYRDKLKPVKDFVSFSAFVCFFPQLVAGPIERATNLLPQFSKKRVFKYSKAVDGMKQILWGLFKKLVIADNCAIYADIIFDHSNDYSGSTLVLGALFFSFQIYGDFSGYSDIAIGTSRLFGFDLKQNFAFPYFSRNMAEFWRRWHISLSTWFRDYVYIPLGGSRGSFWNKIRNVFIIFLISGFWHGANWTFIIWGGLNALYFIPLMIGKRNRVYTDIVASGRNFPAGKELILMFTTFSLTVFGWIIFRAEDMGHVFQYISTICSFSLFTLPSFEQMGGGLMTIILVIAFVLMEWIGRSEQYAIEKIGLHRNKAFRWIMYIFIIVLIGIYMQTKETPFIYFQF